MQTLITGTPGAGKTLHAIEKLLLPLVGKTITQTTDDGAKVEIPRRIYTNIKGLQIEHELVENGPAWTSGRDGFTQGEGHRKGWHNWHEWAPPGAVLVVDEFQKTWPPRPNGAAVPPDVQAMDTHRHMGVDMILISQNPNNFDRHIAGLIGRHLHVRRIANMPLAIVYEWDHCSRTLMFSKSVAKAPWRYNRKVFKLYHSADLHTKQPRKVPPLLFVVVLALLAVPVMIPNAISRVTGKQEEAQKRSQDHSAKAAGAKADRASAAPHEAAAAPVPLPPPGSALVAASSGLAGPPAYTGCIASPTRCQCFDTGGAPVAVAEDVCREGSHRVGFVIPSGRGYGGNPHVGTSVGQVPPQDPPMPSPSVVSSRPAAPASHPASGG